MAWIKTTPVKKKKPKILPVNSINFPELNSYYSGECVSPTKGDNWVRCHTGGDGAIVVQLGNFSTKGYKQLIFNCSSNNWGRNVPDSKLYVNGSYVQTISRQGTTDVTVNVSGNIMNATLQCSFIPNDDAWVEVHLNSVTFVP